MEGGGAASIFVCKVIISVCLFVGLSDHKSGTPRPIYLNLWLGNLGEPREFS